MIRNAKLFGITIGVIFLFTGCRSNLLLTRQDTFVTADIQKGKTILDAVANEYGYQNFQNFDTYTAHVTIEATSFLGKIGHSFKDNPTEITFTAIPEKVGGELRIIDGKQKGEVWGYQQNIAYKKNQQGDISFRKYKKIAFQVPTIQYLIELPMRINTADKITFLKDSVYNNTQYHIIFASWRAYKPQRDIDQYRLWVNAETQRIDIVEFTVREKLPFVWSRLFFSEFKEFEGVTFATSIGSHTNFNLKKEALHITLHDLVKNERTREDLIAPIKSQ